MIKLNLSKISNERDPDIILGHSNKLYEEKDGNIISFFMVPQTALYKIKMSKCKNIPAELDGMFTNIPHLVSNLEVFLNRKEILEKEEKLLKTK